MLASGKVDAVISARAPETFAPGGPVVRLYPNYRTEEERLFKKTGIFPIMHLMTMRRTAFEQHPWIAMNLYKMFDEAKRRCLSRLTDFTCARIPLPWAAAIADEIVAGYGPDPFPYGIEESRPTLEAFCRYAHDQGVTHRRMTWTISSRARCAGLQGCDFHTPRAGRRRAPAIVTRPAHDPELDPGWTPVFGKDHAPAIS